MAQFGKRLAEAKIWLKPNMETLQRTANRGSVATGYDVDNSVSLQTAGVNSEFLNYNVTSAGSRTKGTVSLWIKRSSLGTLQYIWEQGDTDNDNGRLFARFGTDDTLRLAGGSTVFLNTNRAFRDISAWYHIVVAIDTTSGTADNRARIYINGVEETSFSTRNNFSEDDVTGLNFQRQYIGSSTVDNASYQTLNAYVAEVFGADGLVYAASDFGEFDSSGIWKPKDLSAISSSVGTNGFYLKFENAGSMGANSAGSGHGFSVQNINQHDQAQDVPSNNFCTTNPLLTNAGTTNYLTQIRGNAYAFSETNAYNIAVGTIGVSTGKWYWEIKMTQVAAITFAGITYPSIYNADYTLGGTIFVDDNNDPVRYNASGRSAFGSAFGNGDIIAFALDMDASTPTMTVYKNNSSLGNLMAGLSIGGTGTAYLPPKEDGYFPKVGGYGAMTFECNFGGYTSGTPSSGASDANGYGTFEYAPPSGYYALCTKNLAEYG